LFPLFRLFFGNYAKTSFLRELSGPCPIGAKTSFRLGIANGSELGAAKLACGI
jgi:hypothetical protein